MIYRRDLNAIKWLWCVLGAVSRFMICNPGAIPKTIKWSALNICKLPRKVSHKADLRVSRLQIQDELTRCHVLFAQNDVLGQSADLKLLQRNYRAYNITRMGILYVLLRAANCNNIVETGVAEGESTAHILRALADNGGGSLHSVDLPNQFYITDSGEIHAEFNPLDVGPGCLVPQDLRKYWRLTVGSSRDKLPLVLQEAGEIDVFFHDSEHTNETMTFEFETAWPYIRHGGYLISDDATWNSALPDFAKKHNLDLELIEGDGFGIGLIRKP